MKVYQHQNFQYVTIAEIQKSEIKKIDISMAAQPKESLESFYGRQSVKPDILTNAGFFAMSTGESVFTIVDNGVEYSVDNKHLYGFGINNDSDIQFGKYEAGKFYDFICGYPVLVIDGKPFVTNIGSEIAYKARRTMLAIDDTRVLIIVVDNPGMTLKEAQNLVVSLGCKYAINLDGGGSTRMLYRGNVIADAGWSRPVDSMLAVYINDNPQKILYRVQVGAYSKEPNAIAMRNKIRAIGDEIGAGYSNAYVRKIDGLYKVQVGAFSNRNNADKVVDDLRCHGFSSYVTTN